jgi:excisionase family DNA binding protein
MEPACVGTIVANTPFGQTSNDLNRLSYRLLNANAMKTEPWVTAERVVQYLGVAKDAVYRWRERKGLPVHRVGRLWKFQLPAVQQAAFLAWLDPGRQLGQDVGWDVGDDFDHFWAEAGLAGCQMKKTEKLVVGIWRITGMEVWDADYFDMEVAAHVTIRNDLTGEFQFGRVQGDIDARVADIDGVARVEFSWSGADENDPVSGRGWMDVTGDQAQGRIFIHLGDDSAFTSVRQDAEASALQAILQHGEDQLAQGKVKLLAEVVKRLRRLK